VVFVCVLLPSSPLRLLVSTGALWPVWALMAVNTYTPTDRERRGSTTQTPTTTSRNHSAEAKTGASAQLMSPLWDVW
jgi:hypothetical protein